MDAEVKSIICCPQDTHLTFKVTGSEGIEKTSSANRNHKKPEVAIFISEEIYF